MGRFMPPGEFNPKNAVRACTNLLKCHVMAYDYLKANIKDRTGPFREVPLQVGFAHNMIHFVPDRPMHPIENVLAASVSSLYNDAWLNAVNGGRQRFGLLGIMPFAPQVQMALGRRSYDFIGVNYYTRARVQWRPRAQMKESSPQVPVGVIFAKRREVASDLGWPISARGLRLLLQKVKRYKAPVYITENGIADADDLQRRRYILSHLREIARARADGLEIRGYYHWSLIDNFEWIKGFWPRFGLVAIDYETFERKPRRSFDFLRDLISAHRTESADHGPLTAVLDEFEPFT
jgi:beta-glucosidase/6-phospho-beta-glucosidase/beta-galactosidase